MRRRVPLVVERGRRRRGHSEGEEEEEEGGEGGNVSADVLRAAAKHRRPAPAASVVCIPCPSLCPLAPFFPPFTACARVDCAAAHHGVVVVLLPALWAWAQGAQACSAER